MLIPFVKCKYNMNDMTLETIFKQYDFNLDYAKALVQVLTDEQMTIIPSEGLVNHPALEWALVSGKAPI